MEEKLSFEEKLMNTVGILCTSIHKPIQDESMGRIDKITMDFSGEKVDVNIHFGELLIFHRTSAGNYVTFCSQNTIVLVHPRYNLTILFPKTISSSHRIICGLRQLDRFRYGIDSMINAIYLISSYLNCGKVKVNTYYTPDDESGVKYTFDHGEIIIYIEAPNKFIQEESYQIGFWKIIVKRV